MLSAYARVASGACRFSSMWLSLMWNHLVTWSQIEYASTMIQVMLLSHESDAPPWYNQRGFERGVVSIKSHSNRVVPKRGLGRRSNLHQRTNYMASSIQENFRRNVYFLFFLFFSSSVEGDQSKRVMKHRKVMAYHPIHSLFSAL